ncbi:PepSY domain-containing protein [Bacillaceae bacterium Marseille-Q3522]|nr:PepSY domain-containing protein [Bacillaceae bacterium Marseille-Q3522]
MKKKLTIFLLAGFVIFGGAVAAGAALNSSGAQLNMEEKLTVNEAEAIAQKEVDGTVKSVELEKKADKTVYEVKMEKDDINYDVHIDAYSGESYSVNKDDDDDHSGSVTEEQIILKDEAISIAEQAVNGTVHEIEKDRDDGIIKYEIELKTDNGEAEVEVDATTGELLEIEEEDD